MRFRIKGLPLATAPPTVTVVIPNYNYGHYLPAAVRSVLDQPGVDVQVLIVDDASTDSSVEVARALAAADSRVQVIEHKVNMRHIATYNDGLRRATGKYVVLLSADDCLAPGCFERATRLMEAEPDVGLVYGHAEFFSDDVAPATDAIAGSTTRPVTWTRWPGATWLGRICRTGRNPIASPEVVMRTDLLADLGGYDSRFPHSGDLLMWLRGAARADVGRVNGRTQAFYRVHDTNMHTRQFGGLLDDYAAVSATFETFFDEDRDLVRSADRLRQRARKAVSREVVRRTILLSPTEQSAEIDALLDYAKHLYPSDKFQRSVYRHARDSRLGLLVLREMDDFRWKVRYQRQVRFGT